MSGKLGKRNQNHASNIRHIYTPRLHFTIVHYNSFRKGLATRR